MNRHQLVAVAAGVLIASSVCACGPDRFATTRAGPRPLELAKEPYMGIACGRANSISSATACDRIGLAVWLERPAEHVTASIAGRLLTLSNTGERGERLGYWEAFLHPAGLGGGPLRLPRRADDFWAGEPPVSAMVRIEVEYADGSTAATARRLALRPGYG